MYAAQKGWFSTRPLGHNIFAIDDHGYDMLYLVLGEEQALIIDTGFGIGDLASLAASITSLPVMVVNTHGHPDHTTGNTAFPIVYIAEADLPLARQPMQEVDRQHVMERFQNEAPPAGFDPATWGTRIARTIVPIKEGNVFDLGKRKLEVIAASGHTPGSICILDRSARVLFTGDSIHAGTIWMQLEHCTSLREFRTSLRHVRAFTGAFDGILPGHASLERLPLPGSILDDLLGGIDSVLAGTLEGTPHSTLAGDGLRCDFGSCALLYRPDRL